MLEKPVPPRPSSVWVLASLTLWARYDSKASDEPTLITFRILPPAACHWQPLGSLVRFAVGPSSIRASSAATAIQIGTACPARLATVRSITENILIMETPFLFVQRNSGGSFSRLLTRDATEHRQRKSMALVRLPHEDQPEQDAAAPEQEA